MAWYKRSYFTFSLKNFIFHFQILLVKYHFLSAIFGFFVFITIISQIISGTMLSFSLVPEPMIIPIVRDEEDLENLFIDDFFWLHERGVDLIFVFVYLHLLRKLYLNVFYLEQEFAWKSGVFAYLIFFVTTLFGLILCCTHLSEITLTIAANFITTFFNLGQMYWWVFTDKYLNSDTIIRLAYGHYVVAFYLLFLSLIHALDMHYDWKHDVNLDGLDTELLWFEEGFANEVSSLIDLFGILFCTCLYLYHEPEALSYEIFMWGDVGTITDVRFYGVAPHWYFRPFMAWLLVCPFHKTGIFGIIFFFFVLFHQVSLASSNELFWFSKKKKQLDAQNKYNYILLSTRYHIDITLFNQIIFYIFLMSLLYIFSFLPYGRFYNALGGNVGMLFSYIYILIYLSFNNFKNFFWNFFFFNKFKFFLKYIIIF